MIKMTAEESKFLQTGEGNPYPDEKVDLTPEEPTESPPETPAEPKDEAKAEEPEKPEAGEEEEGEEDVIEVADGTNPDGKPRRKVINYGAYDKMRHKANKHAEALAKAQEQIAYLTGLSQSVQRPGPQALPQPAPQELSLTPPDKAKEPEKYLAWLEEAAKEALTIKRQTAQQTEQATQFQQINQTVYEHEQAFINGDKDAGVEPHPDFNDAVTFLQDKHRAELKEAGYERHQIEQIMAARAQDVALRALQQGVSPAQRVYSLAKLNGYKKATPVVKETEAEKIARQAEKQAKAGKSISDLPGGESKGGLTAETLANMDPKEFLKSWTSGEAKKVMGWNE